MTISFNDMPTWVIVAAVTRIARIVQHFAEDRRQSHREVINDAIQIAEEAARRAVVDARASDLADKARQAAEEAENDGDQQAQVAALCAAEAATAVRLATDRPSLRQTADRAFAHVQKLGKPECDRILKEDIEEVALAGRGLTDTTPAAAAMLGFVHYQAVHEAGHAVAAYLLDIAFWEVQITYHAGVEFTINPLDDPADVKDEDLPKYCLAYAAGAAAEDLVFGKRWEWGCKGDRHCHKQSRGTDFDADAAQVGQMPGFTRSAVAKVASLLEQRRTITHDDVEQVLKNLRGA